MKFGSSRGSSFAVLGLLLGACAGPGTPVTEGTLGVTQEALGNGGAAAGQVFFETALPHTNGRACATCHIESDHFALTPAHVQTLAVQNPADPLFHRIDSDDPNAQVLTFDHLKAGLVRVTVKLADNLDV